MTQQIYTIPLVNTPQTFNITLAGVLYNLTCRWNSAVDLNGNSLAGWTLDIADGVLNTPILMNIPLTTGKDLLAPYKYMNFGGTLGVYTNGDENAVPTYENLGVDCNLYFVTQSN